MKASVGVRTDVGRVRDSNQDSYLIDEPLFGVADGMGGHLAGDVASATAVETIERLADDKPPEEPEDLAVYLKEANLAVWRQAQGDSKLQGMGTTFTLLSLKADRGELAHVGDSRAYLFRDGHLQQITEDHTLVQRMVREGRLRREDAAHHPQRSIITRAMGVEKDLDVDLITLDLQVGDRLLLCSDGLSSMLDDDTIAGLLSADEDMQAIADTLVDAANAAGGEDNVTVVVLELGSDGNPAPAHATAIPDAADHRIATEPRGGEAREEEEEDAPSRSPWLKRLLLSAVILILLAGAAFAGISYALDNSWFVGTDAAGKVTIYKGIPDEVLGLDLREEEETTELDIEDLPESLQENVRSGIKVDSLEDARRTVTNLEERSQDFGTNRERKRSD